MRLRSVLTCAASLGLSVFVQFAAASPNQPCDFPAGLGDEISKKFPGTTVVTLADLDEYDRKLFKKDHGTRCPGIARVNFYGDGKPTWALVMFSGKAPARKAELVVARRLENNWEIRSLETTDGAPVVWREGPGTYSGVYGDKTQAIRSKTPVIVFCGYGSWAIVYAWTGSEIKKVWVSD